LYWELRENGLGRMKEWFWCIVLGVGRLWGGVLLVMMSRKRGVAGAG